MEDMSLEVYENEDGNVSGAICFEDNIPVFACLSSDWVDSSVDEVHNHFAYECETHEFKINDSKVPPIEILRGIVKDKPNDLVRIDHSLISTMGNQVHIKNIKVLEN